MEGWGTYAPITVAFTREPGSDQTQAALDLDDIRTRMQNDGHDFTNDPVYVVNLTTGVPVMLDMGDGNFPMTPQDLTLYWPERSEDQSGKHRLRVGRRRGRALAGAVHP